MFTLVSRLLPKCQVHHWWWSHFYHFLPALSPTGRRSRSVVRSDWSVPGILMGYPDTLEFYHNLINTTIIVPGNHHFSHRRSWVIFRGGPTIPSCQNSILSCQHFFLSGGPSSPIPFCREKLLCQMVLPMGKHSR